MERCDMLDASMLEVVGKEPVASPTPTEEAILLGEDPEPQEDQAIALHTPNRQVEASESGDAVRPGVIAATPHR